MRRFLSTAHRHGPRLMNQFPNMAGAAGNLVNGVAPHLLHGPQNNANQAPLAPVVPPQVLAPPVVQPQLAPPQPQQLLAPPQPQALLPLMPPPLMMLPAAQNPLLMGHFDPPHHLLQLDGDDHDAHDDGPPQAAFDEPAQHAMVPVDQHGAGDMNERENPGFFTELVAGGLGYARSAVLGDIPADHQFGDPERAQFHQDLLQAEIPATIRRQLMNQNYVQDSFGSPMAPEAREAMIAQATRLNEALASGDRIEALQAHYHYMMDTIAPFTENGSSMAPALLHRLGVLWQAPGIAVDPDHLMRPPQSMAERLGFGQGEDGGDPPRIEVLPDDYDEVEEVVDQLGEQSPQGPSIDDVD